MKTYPVLSLQKIWAHRLLKENWAQALIDHKGGVLVALVARKKLGCI
ncbi:MAG: hypothetical protein KBD36_06085 [Alphaproteobacteria bacterium]|nr:hypothetical protein [Alphaproteobacteria bacterium]MBP9777390.1 hypothetical protein [Alphaproteobacteria bacterium]